LGFQVQPKFVRPSFLPSSIFNEIYSHSLHSNNRTQFGLGRFKFLQIVLKLLTGSSFDMLRWNGDQTYLTLTKFFVLLGKLQGELKYTSCKGKELLYPPTRNYCQEGRGIHDVACAWQEMKWNGVRPMANTNQENITHKSNPIRKLPRACKIPIVSERGK
jgi:hypothetical protein